MTPVEQALADLEDNPDEPARLAGLVLAAEIGRLQRFLTDAEQVRDQRWQMAKDAISRNIDLEAENQRLQTTVDRIPKDAEGNPIFPGDTGFIVRRPVMGGAAHVTPMKVDAVEREYIRNWQTGIARPSEFYRTLEAAEKARNP